MSNEMNQQPRKRGPMGRMGRDINTQIEIMARHLYKKG